jgi:hypothetical protein
MEKLPYDIVRIIFEFLGLGEWKRLGLTCRWLMGVSVGRRQIPFVEHFLKKCEEERCRGCRKICSGMKRGFCEKCILFHTCFLCEKVPESDDIYLVEMTSVAIPAHTIRRYCWSCLEGFVRFMIVCEKGCSRHFTYDSQVAIDHGYCYEKNLSFCRELVKCYLCLGNKWKWQKPDPLSFNYDGNIMEPNRVFDMFRKESAKN